MNELAMGKLELLISLLLLNSVDGRPVLKNILKLLNLIMILLLNWIDKQKKIF
jgi:hypothetical protein